ncbi:MAG TPA: hypothetical protein VD948_03210, partial [Rhodothermales bacterium]|nr:hypothetical protein [Rhodothermales bacterium]
AASWNEGGLSSGEAQRLAVTRARLEALEAALERRAQALSLLETSLQAREEALAMHDAAHASGRPVSDALFSPPAFTPLASFPDRS